MEKINSELESIEETFEGGLSGAVTDIDKRLSTLENAAERADKDGPMASPCEKVTVNCKIFMCQR
jgi:hypothetical protein